MKRVNFSFFISIFFLLTGCGYHWGGAEHTPTVAISYVVGDADGSLTDELIKALNLSGLAIVDQNNAHYVLDAKITTYDTSIIGYRRDRLKVEGTKKNLLGTEQRRKMGVEATIKDKETGKIIVGPYFIESFVDLDYIDGDAIDEVKFVNNKGVPTTVLPFSLGQLESIDAAGEAAQRPLNVQIARKVVDALFGAWELYVDE